MRNRAHRWRQVGRRPGSAAMVERSDVSEPELAPAPAPAPDVSPGPDTAGEPAPRSAPSPESAPGVPRGPAPPMRVEKKVF